MPYSAAVKTALAIGLEIDGTAEAAWVWVSREYISQPFHFTVGGKPYAPDGSLRGGELDVADIPIETWTKLDELQYDLFLEKVTADHAEDKVVFIYVPPE